MGSCVSKSGVRGRDQGDLAVQPTVGNPAAVPTRKKSDDVLTELPHADLKVYIPAADGPLAKREESRCVPWHEFELFRQVAPHDMAELVDRMTIRTYEIGDLIVRKGTIGTTMYFLDQGQAEARVGDTVLEQLVPGDFFGEMAFIATCHKFLRNVPEEMVRDLGGNVQRTCDVKALKTTRVVELSVHSFLTVLQRDMIGNREVLHALATLAPIANARRADVQRAMDARDIDSVAQPGAIVGDTAMDNGDEVPEAAKGSNQAPGEKAWEASLVANFFKGGDKIDPTPRARTGDPAGAVPTKKEHLLNKLRLPDTDSPRPRGVAKDDDDVVAKWGQAKQGDVAEPAVTEAMSPSLTHARALGDLSPSMGAQTPHLYKDELPPPIEEGEEDEAE